MLYNPEWEQKTKADPFTLTSLIAWLEKKPAEENYCYTDNGLCLLAQYYTACGFKNVFVGERGRFKHDESGSEYVESPWTFHRIAIRHGWNFGEALERARQFTAKIHD